MNTKRLFHLLKIFFEIMIDLYDFFSDIESLYL
jgi:hypothetical protein